MGTTVRGQPAAGTQPRRLTGILVIAALGGAFSLLAALRLFGGTDIGAVTGSGGTTLHPFSMGWSWESAASPWAPVLGAFVLLVGVLNLVFVWGAWQRRGWAWGLGLLANGLAALGLLATVLRGDQTPYNALFQGYFYWVVLGYLLTPGMRRALGPPLAAGPS